MSVSPTIDFVAHHLPPLDAGEYTVTAVQEVATPALANGIAPTTFEPPAVRLYVAGPRFALDPTAVAGVFPPAGSLGDHSAVLPHALLTPSTLPWQRPTLPPAAAPDQGTRDLVRRMPWLALLLFDADEAPAPAAVRVADLRAGPAAFPTLPAEPGDRPDDLVTVIDVERATLTRLLPAAGELALLTHVRERRGDPDGGGPTAVVLGNRLPPAGATATVHLVSLEHRLVVPPGGAGPVLDYHFHALPAAAPVRLVSLRHWSFTCTDRQADFHGLAAHLGREPAWLRLPGADGLRARASIDETGALVLTTAHGLAAAAEPGTAVVRDDSGFGPALAFDAGNTPGPVFPAPFPDPAQFTVTAWVKPRSVAPPALRGVVGGGDGLPALSLSPAGGLRYSLVAESRTSSQAGELRNFFTHPDAWVHVAWAKDADGHRIYRDGVLTASRPAPARIWTGPAPYRIGPGWDGLLADVRVYSRALRAAEVAGVMAAERTHQPELAGAFTDLGMVAVEHRMRHGATGVSWYHGPLRPRVPAAAPPPGRPRHADGYLDYHADVDMLDASRAAAWELGRLLMLNARAQAVALHRWKRERRVYAHRSVQLDRAGHLWTAGPDAGPPPFPENVRTFLGDLARCRGIPANYLLPHPDLLPPESMRLVALDTGWTAALVAGAMTIGSRSGADDVDPADPAFGLDLPGPGTVSGVLLRSELVTGRPDLAVDAYDVPITTPDGPDPATALPRVPRAELVPGVLLCLFDGAVATVDLHLPPERMHVGFEPPGSSGGGYRKPLRTRAGRPAGLEVAPVPQRPAPPGRGGVVEMGALVADMQRQLGGPLSVGEVALELIEGVARARFVVDPDQSG